MEGREIPNDIIDLLGKTFEDDPETNARIIFFLTQALVENAADPYINSLQAVQKNPDVFKKVAERMAKDTKKVENDDQYRQFMHSVWNNFLKDNLLPDADGGKKLELAIPLDAVSATAQFSFMKTVSNLPPEAFDALRSVVQTASGPVARYTGMALDKVRATKTVVKVALVSALLAVDIVMNIKRWWKGEITGIRCVNIIDCGVSVAAGVAGAYGGEMIGAGVGGALAGPIGIAVGAVVGGVAGGIGLSIGAQTLCDNLTQWMFGLPKSEALEHSFNFLGLSATASNSDINSCYRKLSLKYHPDKGGSRDNWTRLQYSMAVIREAREE